MPGPERNLRAVNLNLLPTLRAVLRHRNLTRAAEELHVTQSAISNNLKQLRAHFGDELLVKDGRDMRLTAKGASLIEPLEQALDAIRGVVDAGVFDPATSRSTFRIATADYVAAITAPFMARMLEGEAPGISVQIVTAREASIDDLRNETVDLIISPWRIVQAGSPEVTRAPKEFAFEPLISEPLVCMARDDDEEFRQGLTVEQYLSRAHASFHLDLRFHASLEHSFLIKRGIEQFDRIRTSDFTVLPLIAVQSNCIVLLPRSLAKMAAHSMPLQIAPCPLPIPDLELVMVWNRRRDRDPEIEWLKSIVKRAVGKHLV